MEKIYLISCSAKKQKFKTKAKFLYDSPLFKKMYQYALTQSKTIYIISAKHGLVDPEDYLEPYNLKLSHAGAEYAKIWGKKVVLQLITRNRYKGTVVVLAGNYYVKHLKPF